MHHQDNKIQMNTADMLLNQYDTNSLKDTVLAKMNQQDNKIQEDK